jgi:hypothetical protein
MAAAKKSTKSKPKKKAPAKKPEPKVEPKPKAEQPELPDLVKVRVNRASIKYEGRTYVKGAKLKMRRSVAEKLAEPPVGANGQKTGLPATVSILN